MKKLVALAMSLFVGFGLYADDPNTYTGNNNGSWFTDANWSLNRAPNETDDVVIPAGKAVNATTGAILAKSLTITGSGAKLTLGAEALAPQTIATVYGDLTVTAGAQLIVQAGELTDMSVLIVK